MIHHTKRRLFDQDFLFGGAVVSILIFAQIGGLLLYMRHHTKEEERKSSTIFKQEVFKDVAIRGKAFVVYDIIDKRVIAEKNSTEQLPLASLTKVMTSVTARLHHDGEEVVRIEPKSIDGAYDLGLKKGQVWKLNELLKYTLVFSSNDGAQVIADTFGGRHAFVEQMNKDAEDLGLLLAFTQPAGLDEGRKYGGFGSALEMAKLLGIARTYFPELYDATTKTRVSVTTSSGRLTGLPNTNQDIKNYFGAEISKTGYTDDAGGNLGVIVDITLGHPVAIVVLGSTREERFQDVKKLYTLLIKSVQ
jgi:D-alanyl-D-alanine carboxypeptidase